MSLTDLSSVLWRSRELLELLLFKLEEERLVLAAGRSRWFAHATREVEVVLDQLRQTEVARAAYSQGVAGELNLQPDASLAELADAAPPPWPDLLRQHREVFLSLTREISGQPAANRDLLTAGQLAARQTMRAFAAPTEGRDQIGVRRLRLVAGTRSPPSLIDYLR